ncbi:hypothetical protein SAMN04488127_2848 [Bhargavaea ginsengi]|uniref:Uncharacterized protein n=1 Tax=Bhargavaea ginsengi TaxID=426757 RepID=A0A1H7BQV9_9BACL|nr:hypothetical protein SAMN04488127_2848 [Bhargavaea ginsengi]
MTRKEAAHVMRCLRLQTKRVNDSFVCSFLIPDNPRILIS